MHLPEDVPDFVGLIRRTLVDEKTRFFAARLFASSIAQANPLSDDHGSHQLRPSSFGRCSLEFAADVHGMLDLDRADDQRVIMDNGTLMGLWFASLLKAGAIGENMPWTVIPEFPSSYRGVPGNIDALIQWRPGGTAGPREVVEFKSTPSSGEIKDPGERKPSQAIQSAGYALDPEVAATRFTIVTFGYNVGANREGVPYPKLAQHTHGTADWKDRVDAEIDRLETLSRIHRALLDEPGTRNDLADTSEAFRCGTCRFSACERNKNAARFALV